MNLTRRAVACALLIGLAAVHPGAAPAADPPDLGGLLARISGSVLRYYARAQQIVCLETVRLQPLNFGFTPEGRSRVLVYELRVAWTPPTDAGEPERAEVVRELQTVNGRPPRSGDEPGCLDPPAATPDMLAFLLPGHRHEYDFAWAGPAKVDGRDVVRLDYRARPVEPTEVRVRDDCVSFDLAGRSAGRVWVDDRTGDVLRLEEWLKGPVDFRLPPDSPPFGPNAMTVERVDVSVRFKPVVFHDPDEALLLPETMTTTSVIRGSGTPRLRVTQGFSRYQRFITGGRILANPPPP